jgi:AraC-like DNA-binding protein
VENLFENPNSETESLPDKQIPISQTCRMKAALMQLVADLLEAREGGPDEAPHPGLERLRPAIRYMDEHFQENPTLSQLAASVHLAPTYFHRLFRNAMATTPFAYITARRMETARHLLSNNDLPIKQVADKCGYDDPFYFSRTFLKHYGISPSQTRKRGLPGA